MRNRTPDSTTPSSTLESADCWVWFVTEKGLRASGAASMKAAAAELRQTAAELEKAARRLGQDMAAPPNGSGATPDAGGALAAYASGAQHSRLRASGATAPQVFRRLTVCGQYQLPRESECLALEPRFRIP